jgi:hypothetical protein
VSALCLELKEVDELLIVQRAPIKEIDPCASILKIQLGVGKTFEASTLAGNSYKYFSKTKAFEESKTKVGGGYG